MEYKMKNKIKTIVHIAILSFLLPIYAYAQNDATTVIMSGSPIKKDMSDIEGTEQVELTKNEQINYALKKFKGERIGMWEIPIFKFAENKKTKEEIAKRSGKRAAYWLLEGRLGIKRLPKTQK